MIRVFIGYDPRETVAYNVLAHSIQDKASQPVSITPVRLSQLPSFTRRDLLASTEFSLSRFLVPWLCHYDGWAIFMDCDMLCRGDIAELWDYRDHSHTVSVVKHDYRPSETTKFLGARQYQYPRKNWSSVMLFNCRWCQKLTPEYVETAPGLDLHQFKWADDSEIGSLPPEWNHLVGYDKTDAKLAHFTMGGPYFPEYSDCEYSDEWRRAFSAMTYPHHGKQLGP